MLQELLARLAIMLPLVCAAAAVTLLAMKRGWIRLPRILRTGPRTPAPEGMLPDLAVTAVRSLTPSSRVAVVRFHGRDHLVGLSGTSLVLLATASADEAVPLEPETPMPETPRRREPAPWTS